LKQSENNQGGIMLRNEFFDDERIMPDEETLDDVFHNESIMDELDYEGKNKIIVESDFDWHTAIH